MSERERGNERGERESEGGSRKGRGRQSEGVGRDGSPSFSWLANTDLKF